MEVEGSQGSTPRKILDDRFVVSSMINEGAFGRIFEAQDKERGDHIVAIKIVED